MQPNAPGTQGYDAYAYVANNPTTWVDPSGHYTSDEATAAYVLANPRFLPLLALGTAATAQFAPGLTEGMVLAAGFGVVAYLALETAGCVVDSECRAATLAMIQEMGRYGANTWEGVREWTAEQLAKIENILPDDAVPIPYVGPDFAQPNQPPPGCDELPPGVINLDPTKGPIRIGWGTSKEELLSAFRSTDGWTETVSDAGLPLFTHSRLGSAITPTETKSRIQNPGGSYLRCDGTAPDQRGDVDEQTHISLSP